MDRESAISRLVDQDVEKWGEDEREASRRMHSGRTLGLVINELANRAEMAGDDGADELRELAEKSLTDADWRELRKGG